MADVNHVILIGHLTKDIGSDERSFGYASNGQARANVSLAVNRNRKNGDQWIEETSYFDITIWGKTAVDGYLKQDRWEKDGQKFSKVGIVANTVQLLGGKSDGNSSSGNAPRFQPRNDSAKTNSSYSDNYSPDSFGGTGNDFPEDIPF